MKKIVALLLVITLIASSSLGCGRKGETDTQVHENSDNVVPDAEEQTVEHTGIKISGDITGASAFSEGLALVALNGDKEKTYCINKEGYIVFEIDVRSVDATGEITGKFENGLALVGDVFCDAKGKVTTPEDVGATAFSDLALKNGYILAERVISDYSSAKKELGVMDTNFQWIVEPTEVLYNATNGISMIPATTESFCFGDYAYFDSTQKYVNLKTGKVTDSLGEFPSDQWLNSQNAFYDLDNNVMLDLSEHQTIDMPAGSRFINGKAPVRFINRETNKYYFTLVDENGQFAFEPIETTFFQNFVYDGNNILLLDQAIGPKKIRSYDLKGTMLGELNTESVAKNALVTCDVRENVIVLIAGRNFKYTCFYYNSDFTKLF